MVYLFLAYYNTSPTMTTTLFPSDEQSPHNYLIYLMDYYAVIVEVKFFVDIGPHVIESATIVQRLTFCLDNGTAPASNYCLERTVHSTPFRKYAVRLETVCRVH